MKKTNFASKLATNETQKAVEEMLTTSNNADLKKVCIKLYPNQVKALKQKALNENTTLQEIIIRAVENELKK